MHKMPADSGRFIDLFGDSGIGNLAVAAGAPTIIGDVVAGDQPFHIAGWDWVYFQLTQVSTDIAGATLLSIEPQVSTDSDRGTSNYSPLPYEPGVSGTGTTVVYDYVATHAVWTDGASRIFRFPTVGSWVRFQLSLDAGTNTYGSFLVMRHRFGGAR